MDKEGILNLKYGNLLLDLEFVVITLNWNKQKTTTKYVTIILNSSKKD
jgi:hypothetical protein